MGADGEADFAYDPFSQEVMRNPLPFYEVLRRDHPVFYSPKYDGFFFSRFDDIKELLSYIDNRFLQSEGSLPQPAFLANHNDGALPPAPLEPFGGTGRHGLPIHGESRRAHIQPLMPKEVKQLADFIRERANARLDLLLPKGRFNLTRDFAGAVSASVIMKLMGMPLELAETALDLVNAGTRTDPVTGGFDSMAGARACVEFYMPYVEARMAAGADGSLPLLDGLIQWRYNGRALTVPEVAQAAVCVFIGGIESTPKVVAHGLMELAGHPDQLEAVRADLPNNARKAAEEIIRYCAPAQWFMRTAQKPVTVAGRKIEPGQRVFYLVASANRDEREFDDPNEFRWNRDIPRTLAFGYGIHVCIGIHLARLEVQLMVETFLSRVANYSFDMAAADRPMSSFQWGWNTLPVVIG